MIENRNMEQAMMDFANALQATKELHAATAPKRWNLTAQQRHAWKKILKDRRFIVCLSDKNLGPVIIKRLTYMKRVWNDHLSNADVYKRLDPIIARARMKQFHADLENIMQQRASSMTSGMQKYFKLARVRQDYRTPCFLI